MTDAKRRNVKNKVGVVLDTEAKDSDKIYETFTQVKKKKTYQDLKFIIPSLRNHFLFYNLNDQQLETLVKEMFYAEIPANTFIIRQNDNASSFFLLEKGTIEISVNGNLVKTCKPGDGFGELALLYNAPRSASCKSTEPCFMWGIDRKTFRKVVQDMQIKQQQANRNFIEKVQFFKDLQSEQKDQIASVLIEQKFNKDQTIFKQGDCANCFYICLQGNIQVVKDNKKVMIMKIGDSFGENALLSGQQSRSASCEAMDEVKLLVIARDQLNAIFGEGIEMIIYRNKLKWALEKQEGFTKMSKNQKLQLLDLIQPVNKKKGEIIFKKGSLKSDFLGILLEGTASHKKETFKQNALFGATEVAKSSKDTWEHDVIAESDSIVGLVENKQIISELGGEIQQLIQKNHKATIIKQQADAEHQSEVKQLSVDNFKVLKKLGNGQFGNVYLVIEKNTQKHYALKCITKQSIIEQNLERHLEQEKQVMLLCDHPCLMKYYTSFKDEYYIYFLLEFIQGMDLFDAIREIGLLSTSDTQHYIGCMLQGLEYLYENNTIYRDLKPENCIVDTKGMVRLIDMGTAKVLKSKDAKNARTFTIIGTPHYMAPEVITGKGYTMNVDLWSVGICLYEFMCGFVPFGEEAEDPYLIYDEIIKKEVIGYPSYFHDSKGKQLIEQFLSKIPEIRLAGGYNAIKRHAWFKNFSFEALLEGKIKAPLIPQVNVLKSEEVKKNMKNGKGILESIKQEIGTLPTTKKKGKAGWDDQY